MSITTRLAWILSLFVVVSILSNAWLSANALQHFNDDTMEVHNQYLLRALARTIEANLLIGQEIDQMDMMQAIIERERIGAVDMLAIDIYSANGTILYSTDPGTRGSAAPQAWLDHMNNTDSWRIVGTHEVATGMYVGDEFRPASVGIAITTLRSQATTSWETWLETATNVATLTVLFASATMLLAFLAGRVLLLPYSRVARILAASEDQPPPKNGRPCALSDAATAFKSRHADQRNDIQRATSTLEELDNAL